ncbi:MAG TPA: NAD(P)H-hydrate dehydratase [Polyangiales bacterium]
MIPLLTREACRAIDADAITRLGVPGIELMEHAGRGAFDVIGTRMAHRLSHVVLVCGAGQNGGDGWVVARCLSLAGHAPRCVLVGERAQVRGDAAVNLAALDKLGVDVAQVHASDDLPALEAALSGATLVVDALFGTGLDRPITGVLAQAVERINQSAAPVVALDLPSGVDANTGAVLGVAVRAQLTVTFAAHKRGLHQHPGASLAGEVVCVSIGVPSPTHAQAGLIEAADVRAYMPRRALDTHKGEAGHVLVVAGAPGRTGAALLSGMGAMRAGAGLVTLCPRAGARAALDAKVIELMTADLPQELEQAVTALHALAADKDALVVGPGLGTDPQGAQLARRLAVEAQLPAVLDADALTALVSHLSLLHAAAGARVLTPHPGEAARLLGCSSAAVQQDRHGAALRLAEASRSVVVLKGAATLIAQPDGRMRVCPRGTPAMAVAGTGDVLSGVIAALLVQLSAFDAASVGVYLHAVAGELAARSDRGLLARELADAVPAALEAVRGSD